MADKTVKLSTTLNKKTKDLLERFCKNRGLKMNHFLEEAILEKLEDEIDCEIINQRENEELIPWGK